jgi:hypothetical protein
VSRWLGSALGVGQAVATVFRALVPRVPAAGVAAVFASWLLLAFASIRFLRDLILRKRSWAYVDPI